MTVCKRHGSRAPQALRHVRHAAAWLLAAALVSGCEAPAEVTLALLVDEARTLHGRDVITSGVVRGFDDPLHYWIEDDTFNRVELIPAEAAAPHLHQAVRVRGRFTYATSEGRRIAVADIEPI